MRKRGRKRGSFGQGEEVRTLARLRLPTPPFGAQWGHALERCGHLTMQDLALRAEAALHTGDSIAVLSQLQPKGLAGLRAGGATGLVLQSVVTLHSWEAKICGA